MSSKRQHEPKAHQVLEILSPFRKEILRLWGTCDLIETRLELTHAEVGFPSPRAEALESCRKLKAEAEADLPVVDGFHHELLRGIAEWCRDGMAADSMVFPCVEYDQWIRKMVQLQYSTRYMREQVWLESELLPWSDSERDAVKTLLLWETSPPEWLRLACNYHRLPLVSEPVALKRNEPVAAFTTLAKEPPTSEVFKRIATHAEGKLGLSDSAASLIRRAS
ncbi:hypothetical protein [Actomonas aquatica]|uniref:Uncharacterized protein n=1 Tax=Actomonas aquatica TaxID=2866162 RepID=A0ABZ1C884_9BACT|nr:hypothetical protein [Opitutus sp. WL0086]WRQ86520.1 hypothetical protein K1X11_017045 [Opitutus sp. WL0086]